MTGSGRIRLTLVVYGLMGAGALLWGALRGDLDLYHHPEPWLDLPFPVGTLGGLGAGVGVAVAVIFATRVLVRRTSWARALHGEFRDVLGPLRTRDIVVFAATSGVAEEMLFRGAMQPTLGLVASSLLFGAVHLGPTRRFWTWTVWAALMGFVFGALYAATGELLAPIVAHFLINYENLHFIEAYDPTTRTLPERRASGSSSGERLVAGRLRTGGRSG